MEEKEVLNSTRFISAYNSIDYALRTIYNQKRSTSFSDAVRRAAKENSMVAKFEDKLIDYSRLRNSIVHTGNVDYVLAEPHDEVTEEIERIEKLLTTPPRALSVARKQNIVSVEHTETIADALKLMHGTGYKNLPVFKNETIIGVANLNYIAVSIAKQVFEKKDVNEFILNTKIDDVLKDNETEPYFTIKSEKLTIDEALTLFYENRKLLSIIITKNGTFLEKPIGILTLGDIIELNKIIDEY